MKNKKANAFLIILIVLVVLVTVVVFFIYIKTTNEDTKYYKATLNLTCLIVNIQGSYIQANTNQQIQPMDCDGVINYKPYERWFTRWIK